MSKLSYSKLRNSDLSRLGGADSHVSLVLKYFRRCQSETNPILLLLWRYLFKQQKAKYLIEIYGKCNIGPGLYLGHAYAITINPDTVIGANCNIHKGVTIGQENRGKRRGVPTIGNCVWIGVNATLVGKITVGDDVLIAPNTFVNCDIPSHSIVYGNPCVIVHRDNATEGYINNKWIVPEI